MPPKGAPAVPPAIARILPLVLKFCMMSGP